MLLRLLDELLQDFNASITAKSVLFNCNISGLHCSICRVYTALSTNTTDEKLPTNTNTKIYAASVPEALLPPTSILM